MRKFIISDIHGFGNVYYSLMSYLDNISEHEEIELYINGDLSDRGLDSGEILLDIKKRIEDNKFKINYLGGNHELMMYEFFQNEKINYQNPFNLWFDNGGFITYESLSGLLNYDNDKIKEIVNLVSNLKIYHKFEEKIGNKPIVLVHAACPKNIEDHCDLRIKDDNDDVSYSVWAREHEIRVIFGHLIIDPREQRIGNNDYFTIIGHTPVEDKYGFEYHKKQNYLNIDGGCAAYVTGHFDYNHFPLVEVCDGYLKILTFNDNNEIVYGNYFDGEKVIPYSIDELGEARKYIDSSVKTKKLYRNSDGIILYKE